MMNYYLKNRFFLVFISNFFIYNLLISNIFSQQNEVREDYQKFYYVNGNISSEGYMVNGKPDRYWKSYYENGTLKSEGNRKSFELDSIWKFYDEDGGLTLEISYENGKKHGIRTTYLDQEIIRENFIQDVKEGYTKYFHPNGKIKSEIPFVKGVEQGIGKEYSLSGDIITVTEYKRGFIVDRIKINRRDKENKKQGKWITFWDNGKIKQEGNYTNDMKNGYFKEYSEDGNLIRIEKYLNDKIQPEAVEIQKLEIQKTYYTNGNIKTSTTYRNGILEGIKKEYSPEGKIERAFEYHQGNLCGEGLIQEDGSKDGYWKEYYPDGSLKSEGDYQNGKPAGLWKYYHPNQTLEQTGNYTKNGQPEGVWRWYYENGQLLREENYYLGLKDGISEEYDENGFLIEQGEYYEGREEGPWVVSVGDYCLKGNYQDGLRTGIWYSYLLIPDETGSNDSVLLFKGNFFEDLPDGKHTSYWDNGNIKDEGVFIAGKKEGNWIKYNYDGSLFMVISYENGIETRYDGIKIKPPYEFEE